MNIIGLDVGTTGCKACVFNPAGEILGYGFREYGIDCTAPLKAEQDAQNVWNLSLQVLTEAVIQSGPDACAALSLSVQGDAVIPVDKNINPLFPAVLGMDYRSESQARKCEELIGGRKLFSITGMRSHPMNSLTKIMWFKENHPAIYSQTWKFMTYADFILTRLGANPVIDYTMASRTMCFDLEKRCWSSDILTAVDIDISLLSDAVPSATVVGTLRKELAEKIGLTGPVPLVTGGHDQTCAGIGAGLITPGVGLISTGTAEVLSTASAVPVLDDSMYDSFYPCYLHACPQMYFTFSLNHVGGLLLKWYRDTFCTDEIGEAAKNSRDPYDMILERIPEGPSSVMVLPHFAGSGTPWCDTQSKGAILGLTLKTGKYDVAKAILESLTYELKTNLQTIENAGVTTPRIIAAGGGAKSKQWLGIKADILGRNIETLAVREAACLGAALCGGVGTGIYPSFGDAVDQTVEYRELIEPDTQRSAHYQEKFSSYEMLYPALRPFNHGI